MSGDTHKWAEGAAGTHTPSGQAAGGTGTPGTPPDSIIRKIQKLLALGTATRNNSEEEAAAAMAKAQELLAAYNLDLAIVEQAALTPEAQARAAASEKREKTEIDKGALYQWQRDLWKAVAEANFCWYWRVRKQEEYPSRKYKDRHVVLGRESNVLATQLMAEYLIEAMDRLLPFQGPERMYRRCDKLEGGVHGPAGGPYQQEDAGNDGGERKGKAEGGGGGRADYLDCDSPQVGIRERVRSQL